MDMVDTADARGNVHGCKPGIGTTDGYGSTRQHSEHNYIASAGHVGMYIEDHAEALAEVL